MAIKAAVARVASNTGTGTQDITVTDFGTPKAALFFINYAITDGTAADHAGVTYGATDGTNEWCVHGTSEHGQATTDTDSEITATKCVIINLPGTANADGEATFSAWITDGVRINWTNAPAAAYLLTVVLFGGDDLSAFVGSQVMTDTENATATVSDVGFEAHLVFSAVSDFRNAGSLVGVHNRNGFGVVHNDGAAGITQRSHGIRNDNGGAADNVGNIMSTTHGAVISFGGSTDWGASYDAFTSSGFDITELDGGGNNSLVHYLCLAGASPSDFAVGTYTTPTSTGNDSITGVGFTPQMMILGMTLLEAADQNRTDARAGSTGVSVFDTSAEFSTTYGMEDGADPTNTQSLSDDTAVNIPLHDGAAGVVGAYSAMEADGAQLNFSAVHANAKYFWWAAIKAEAPAGMAGASSLWGKYW